MKRDMDLCRKILAEVETWETTCSPGTVEIDGYDAGQIGYNAWLLAEERLIDGLETTGDGDAVHYYMPRCLTYKGHDFLEHARDETRWKKAKETIGRLGGALTTQTLLTVLKQLLTRELGT